MDEDQSMQEQIRRAVARLRQDRWLVFEGVEALDLLHRVTHFQGDKPILMIHCERGPGIGTLTYEHFVPDGVVHLAQERMVQISGTMGPGGSRQTLCWSPDKCYDAGATHITYVSTLPKYFPGQALAQVRLVQLSL